MTTVNETLAREILDRLTRVEAATAENGRRIDETNQRITEQGNLLLEAIRQVSERNAEAIAQAREESREANAQAREENRATNAQAREESREANARIDRLTARVDRLFYAIIGVGAAVVATLAATQFAM